MIMSRVDINLYLSSLIHIAMKNKNLIIIASFLAVVICLILSVMLFYSVPPTLLVKLSFATGLISGVCITLLIHNLINMTRTRREKKD
jgi:hypothetical protein